MTNNSLFFPFTHITQKQLSTILAFFPSFQYLSGTQDFKRKQALQELCNQGKIHPVFLSPEEFETVEQKVEQYQAWAQIHKGNEANLKSILQDNPYFISDTNIASIKSQIKGFKEDKADSGTAVSNESALQHNLLFLKIAQLCDEQNERIDLKLKELDTSRDNLMSNLRGIGNPLNEAEDNKADASKDSGAVMTRERIYAWSRCMAQKGALKQEGDSPLFITTSEAVFTYLESICQDVINALDIDKIKVHENKCENKTEWQHHFCDYLMRAIQGNGTREKELPKVSDGCSLSGQIKLCLFSGNDINMLFNSSEKQIPVCLIKLK